MPRSPVYFDLMRRLPKGVDASSLPDLAHYRGHGIDRLTAWCLTPLCCHQGTVTFVELAAYCAKPAVSGDVIPLRKAST